MPLSRGRKVSGDLGDKSSDDEIRAKMDELMKVAKAQLMEEILAEMKADGVDIIILVSHLQGLTQDLDLIPQLRGVDIAIAGGGDDLLANPGDLLIPGDEGDVGIGKLDIRQNIERDHGMPVNLVLFLIVEPPGLEENAVVHGDLPDVVQVACYAHRRNLFPGQAHPSGDGL